MPPRELVDSHVHLHAYPDYEDLLSRAQTAGVNRVVAVGVDLVTSDWNVGVARRRSDVTAGVGIHPTYLRAPIDDASLRALESLAGDDSVGFIGEIGLDSIDGQVDVAVQVEALEAMLRIAKQVRKPVNLHLRGDFDGALAAIRRSSIADVGAVCHYFVGDVADARRFLDAGFIISVGKPVTRLANGPLRDAVRFVPHDRLLVETDSYPLPGRSTEPANLPLVVDAVADLWGCSSDAVVVATSDVYARLTGLKRK